MAAALERPSLTALGQPGARSRDKLARIPVRVEPAAGAAARLMNASRLVCRSTSLAKHE
jgi:hypothetical protein